MNTFTVCVPTLNARGTWKKFAAAIASQRVKPEQVIVIDSESDDGTPELARNYGFAVTQIQRRDFCHGATRQYAADLCGDSEVLLYMTQDAIPASSDAFGNLLKALDDPAVGAAYGCQLPRRGANAIEAHARNFNYPERSSITSINNARGRGFKVAFFSNSFGAYRRKALHAVGGFPLDVTFGEDSFVAGRMLLADWKIAYVSDAQVYHSHCYTIWNEFSRAIQIGNFHTKQSWLVRQFGSPSGEGLRFVTSELKTLARRAPWLIPSAVIRTGSKLVGYFVGSRVGTSGFRRFHTDTQPQAPSAHRLATNGHGETVLPSRGCARLNTAPPQRGNEFTGHGASL